MKASMIGRALGALALLLTYALLLDGSSAKTRQRRTRREPWIKR